MLAKVEIDDLHGFLSSYCRKNHLIVSVIMVLGALDWEEVTATLRPERLIEPNIQCLVSGRRKGRVSGQRKHFQRHEA